MRDYPRDTAAAKRYDGLGAGRSGGHRPTSGRETMHALSQSPRMGVIALLLVHQAEV
jgi:hypothetical protein